MSTSYTAEGYIFPNGDNPIRNGDNVARKLAEQLPARLIRQASSSAGTNVGLNNVGETRVTFPTPYAGNPLVAVWCSNNPLYLTQFTTAGGTNGIDNTSFVIRCVRATDGTAVTNTTIAIRWLAIGPIPPTP